MATTFGEDELPPPPPESLKDRIFTLAQEMRLLEAQLLEHEEQGKELKARYMSISGGFQKDGALPAALQQAGVKGLLLPDHSFIVLDEVLKVPSMAKDSQDREKVINWMEENGQGGVVKNEFKVLLDKGNSKKAAALQRMARRLGLCGDLYATIHPATLKKTVEDLLENGVSVPMTDLNIQTYIVAEFQAPKKSKRKG